MTASTISTKGKRIGTALLAAAFWLLVWQGISLLVAQELLVPAPLQVARTLGQLAGDARFWQAAGGSLLRVAVGFAAALAAGSLLAVLTVRFRAADVLLSPLLKIVRAAPVASFIILALVWIRTNTLPAFIAFLMVVPVVWGNVEKGIRETDAGLLEMAKVYRLPLTARLRYIWLPGIFPSFCESCIAAMGMCWKSGVSAEVIGLPDHSVGDALYRAKITLSTPDVFAWTLVIVLLSAALSAAAAALLRTAKTRLCGEVRV